MTAIVGIACQDGNVILGADSLASDSDSRFVVKTPKLWRLVLRERGKRRDLVIGYTTSFRMGDLLRVHMGNVSVRQGLDAEEFLIAEFVPALREHSRKPDEARQRIEAYCGPTARRLELFARSPAAGWTVWGNETEKFAPRGGLRGEANRE